MQGIWIDLNAYLLFFNSNFISGQYPNGANEAVFTKIIYDTE